MKKSVLSITPSVHKSTIAPEIYGQFSEHLGRCIYDGVYVGEDSDIPNTNGMRNDVVCVRLRFLYCAGRVDAMRMNIIGKMALARRSPDGRWSIQAGAVQ